MCVNFDKFDDLKVKITDYLQNIGEDNAMLSSAFERLEETKQELLGAGVVNGLAPVFLSYSLIYFHCGLQLEPLDRDIATFSDLLVDTGQRYFLSILETHGQFVQNLMGKSKDPLVLTGKVMRKRKSAQSEEHTIQRDSNSKWHRTEEKDN